MILPVGTLLTRNNRRYIVIGNNIRGFYCCPLTDYISIHDVKDERLKAEEICKWSQFQKDY